MGDEESSGATRFPSATVPATTPDDLLRMVRTPSAPRPTRKVKGIGRARCHGAISVVNAIATGQGASVGITLQAEAEVKVLGTGHLVVDIVSDERETTNLVRTCIQRAFQAGDCGDLGAWVTTWSEIPASRGLKSSSAVANAVIVAALDAVDALDGRSDDELIRMGVEAAVTAGVTITGAFDDASACFRGGLCLTDNGRRELLRRDDVDPSLVAVLHIPAQRISKPSIGALDWKSLAPSTTRAMDLAKAGDWMQALRVNGEACATLLGVSQEPARVALEAGALTAGMTGTGPATATVCEARQAKEVERALRKLKTGAVVRASLTNAQAEVVRKP
jgi:shikimate kinase